MTTRVSGDQVRSYRIAVQQLDREPGSGSVADTRLLDLGVQDTGPDRSGWALALRGVDPTAIGPGDLAMVWTLRGAPHAYRRADLGSVAAATQPFSEADAAKRMFDASKPLRAAGIDCLTGLDTVAEAMRAVVTRPMVKGDVSTALTARLDEPYLRFCRGCDATHCYEMPFRFGAFRGGLELQAGTSPPVLSRIPGRRPGRSTALPRHDVVRGCLRLLGPQTPKQVSEFLDASAKDVAAHWPQDAVPVDVDGEARWILEDDLASLAEADATATRLLGPYDLFLQTRDRRLLVDDATRAKALWPVLGRPGAVLLGRDIAGLWRPRQSGGTLGLQITPWARFTKADQAAITTQAERLAAFRGVRLGTLAFGS